jgi:hypothetical protein
MPCSCQGGEVYSFYSFLTLAVDGGEWLLSYRSRALPLGKPSHPSGTHWVGGWVGLRDFMGTEARGKILSLYRHRIPVVQSVVRHYTD